MTTPEYTVSIEDFKAACLDRIEHARTIDEAGYQEYGSGSERFETPAGLVISRLGGFGLNTVSYTRENGTSVYVDFLPEAEGPKVTEDDGRSTSRSNRTIKKREQGPVFAELAKYVTLIPHTAES